MLQVDALAVTLESVRQMGRDDLESLTLRLATQVRKDRKRIDRLSATSHAHTKKILRLSVALSKVQADVEAKAKLEKQEKVFRGPGERFFTLRGGLSLALRRTISGVASNRLGLALGQNIGRRQITSAEIRLRAALIAATQASNREHRARLLLEPDESLDPWEMPASASDDLKRLPSWRFSCYSVRGDGTNSAVWQKQKLRCNEMRAFFCCDAVWPFDQPRDALESVDHTCLFSDIQVRKESSKEDNLGMLANQTKWLGMSCLAGRCGDSGSMDLPFALEDSESGPLPLEDQGDAGAPAVDLADLLVQTLEDDDDGIVPMSFDTSHLPWPRDRLDEHRGSRVITSLVFTTDAGPDECGARRCIQGMFGRCPNVFIFDGNCLHHQYQLMILNSIKLANEFLENIAGMKYLPVLTKLMHIWRERAVSIFEAYCAPPRGAEKASGPDTKLF